MDILIFLLKLILHIKLIFQALMEVAQVDMQLLCLHQLTTAPVGCQDQMVQVLHLVHLQQVVGLPIQQILTLPE